MISEELKQKYQVPTKPVSTSIIEKADDVVDIRDILKQMGIWTPDALVGSYKIDCPWAFEHEDGGRDKNCRIFGSRNIYCWAQHGYITSTILYSRWKNISRKNAAFSLLDQRGLLHKPWQERWNEIMQAKNAPTVVSMGSQNELVIALHKWLEQDETYVRQEFSPQVRQEWETQLELLDQYWQKESDTDELMQWFGSALDKLKQAAHDA